MKVGQKVRATVEYDPSGRHMYTLEGEVARVSDEKVLVTYRHRHEDGRRTRIFGSGWHAIERVTVLDQ